jgi:radical SAM protein with 4Fe4S-binding SPASM domain
MSVIPENISKIFLKDPEKGLKDELTRKFGNRFLEYRSRYEQYLNDKNHLFFNDYPISVILELVNRCNLECVMCHQEWRNDSKSITISSEMLDKLFIDFKENKLPCLILSISEPLLYKDLKNILKRAEDANIMDIFIFTNGILLTPEKSKEILNTSITRLFISIDAATSATYNLVRVPVSKRLKNLNRLQDLENNVINFVKMRNNQKKILPLVRTSFVGLKQNSGEIKQFISKWKGIVESVEIQRESSIDAYAKIKSSTEDTKPKLDIYNCQEPWGQISIYSDGTVAPCCNTIGRNIPVGNINRHSIKEIWNNDKMKEIREGFKKNNPSKVCRICIEESQSEVYKNI